MSDDDDNDYDDDNEQWPKNDTCPVCCELFYEKDEPIVGLDACEHLICLDCLKLWAKEQCVCPLCRSKFSKALDASGQVVGEFKPNEPLRIDQQNFPMPNLQDDPCLSFSFYPIPVPLYFRIDLSNAKLGKLRPKIKQNLRLKMEKESRQKEQKATTTQQKRQIRQNMKINKR